MGTGRQVTDAQVKEVRLNLNQGGSLRLAAMKAGMDRKTARKYRDLGHLPSETSTAPRGRRRPDPLVNVWARLEELLHGKRGRVFEHADRPGSMLVLPELAPNVVVEPFYLDKVLATLKRHHLLPQGNPLTT
jgi:hypothetical protein